jgi:hypothetical protein
MNSQPRIHSWAAQALVILLFWLLPAPLRANTTEESVDLSYRYMYNLQFDAALQTAEEAKLSAGDDPLPWIAQSCAILFREFERLHILNSEMFTSDEKFAGRKAWTWNTASKKEFENALAGAERLAQSRLNRDKNDVKALFALTIVNGLRGDDAALIEKKNLTALSYTKSANSYAERLLARAPDYYDAYVATGLGKYLIGARTAPVRWILRLQGLKGDQEEGLKELTLAADRGRYLAPFARILLAFDDLRHKNKAAARKELAWLNQEFPKNPHYHEEMAKIDHPALGTAR